MPKSTEPLTPAQVYRFAVAFCQPRLAFRSVGKVTSEVLVTVLFAAAVRISSISETCRRLRDAPCEETYANALYANLFCLEELKRKVNAAFVDHLPRPLRRPRKRPLRLGVDLTLLPYYGQHSLESREIYRSQAKRGTNSFFAYATAYLVLQGQRFTLAVTPVMRSECLKEVLQELLLLVSKAGLKPGLLLLDRGFYSVAVIRYLQGAAAVPHASCLPRPQGRSSQRPQRVERLQAGEEERVVPPHPQGRQEGQGHGLDLREAVAVGGPAWPEEERHMGLRVLGDHPQAGRLGEGDVPETVRDRDELSADEPVPDSDDDEEVQRAVPVRGDRLVAEEPVGLASSLRPVEPTAGWSTVQLGSPARGTDAALAGACGRNDVWTGRHNSNGKRYARISSVLTHRTCSFGKY